MTYDMVGSANGFFVDGFASFGILFAISTNEVVIDRLPVSRLPVS
jgi:hypothetical protein